MKSKILNIEGKPGKEVELPSYFSETIREDIAQKLFEASKSQQPYGPNPLSGKKHSASGKLSRKRHKWKTSYGYGIARSPRKIFWRRGTRFYWVGAFVNYARGGRAAHAPQPQHFFNKLKINKKEVLIALKSALASTSSSDLIKKRYSTLVQDKLESPFIVDSKILALKTKEFHQALEKIFKDIKHLITQKKTVRAGKGKLRGRKYKTNAGLLLVIGKDENKKIQGIDIRKITNLQLEDLFPLGRLTLFTEKAIEDLKQIGEKVTIKQPNPEEKKWEMLF